MRPGYDGSRPAPGNEYRINVCVSTTINGAYVSPLPPNKTPTRSLTDTAQVDRNGVSCRTSGGTTVLASHDNVYGPGGQ